MRRLVTSLALCIGLTACDAPTVSDTDAGPQPDGSIGDAARVDAPMGCTGPSCGELLPSFTVTNPSTHARTEVIRVSLPFARGEIAGVDRLTGIGVDGVPAELTPLEWHYDSDTGERDSVAIALLRVPMTLAAGETRELTPVRDGSVPPPHTIGPATLAWLPTSITDAVVHARLGDGTELSAPIFGAGLAVVEPGNTSTTLRHRGHFVAAGGALHPLSLTVYVTIDAGSDQGEIVVLVGNDTLEVPVSGGIDVAALEVEARAPFRFGVRDPSAYGITPPAAGDVQRWALVTTPTNIGDGANLVFRGRYAVTASASGPIYESHLAALEHRLFPLASHAAWRASGAVGSYGYLPAMTGTAEARLAEVAAGCTDPIEGTPTNNLGNINLNPPSTGDQPDFGSGAMPFVRQALETSSPCPLRRAAIAVDREALRPSFYWMIRAGVEDRVSSTDFPTLMFWGGRLHYDPSWNSDQPLWLTRTGTFDPGDAHGWGGMDDQHYGNNSLRGVYELTGDPYLRELLVAHQSLLTWLFFTDYAPSLGAERSMRLMEEAIALYAVQDDTDAAARMRAGFIDKNRRVLAAVEERTARVRNPSYGTVRNDGRVTLTTMYPDQDVIMAWQTGFHMEVQSLAIRNGWDPDTARAIAEAYLAASDLFFLADGTPVTYFLESDPTQLNTGGIGASWWAGWIQIAETLPTAPGADRVLGPVRTLLCQEVSRRPGRIYDPVQRWHSFECP